MLGLGCDCSNCGVGPRWSPGLGDVVQNPYAPGGALNFGATDPSKIYNPYATPTTPPPTASQLITPIPSIPANAPAGTYYDPVSGNFMVPYLGPAPSYAGPGPGAQPMPAGENMFGAPVGFIPVAPGLLAASLSIDGGSTVVQGSNGGGAPLTQTPVSPGATPTSQQTTITQQLQQGQLTQQQIVNSGGANVIPSSGVVGSGTPLAITPGIWDSITNFFSNLTPTELIIGAVGVGIVGLYMFSSGGPGGKFRIYGG